jgi:hypothetical protein
MSKSINLVNPNSNNRYINQINNFSPDQFTNKENKIKLIINKKNKKKN